MNEKQRKIVAVVSDKNEDLATKQDIAGLRSLVGISIVLSLASIGGIIAVLVLLVQLISRL